MYEKLFSPGAIGTLTIPNRIVMTAASASLSQPDGTMTEDMLAYYEARAKGGVGLIITEMVCVDEARGRVPVYAGTGCVGTQDTIDLSLAAQEIGVDVLSVITPYFAALSQEELYRHYADIAAAVKLPIVMYNIPMRTGCAIEPETVSRLAKDFSNIRGVKDSSGKFENILAYIHGTDPEHFSVLSGNDALILKTLQNGGKGGITAVANILPEMMVSIYQNWKKGDMAAAEAAQQGIQPIRDCFKYGNPNSIVKRAANLIGQPLGPCRKPFGMVSEETDNAILDTIDRYYAAYKR